jgi:predicted membrane channel-forming protein YqfA (hemolysin III family)
MTDPFAVGSHSVTGIVSGAIVMGHTVVGLFFWRFWRQTRDRLFLAFAVAFGLLGVQRLTTALTGRSADDLAPLLVVRLLAYSLILIAIVAKNRPRRTEEHDRTPP